MAATKSKATAKVAAKDWTPDSVGADGEPIYPEGVDRIDMTGPKSCLVIVGNDAFQLQDYRQLADALEAYNTQ